MPNGRPVTRLARKANESNAPLPVCVFAGVHVGTFSLRNGGFHSRSRPLDTRMRYLPPRTGEAASGYVYGTRDGVASGVRNPQVASGFELSKRFVFLPARAPGGHEHLLGFRWCPDHFCSDWLGFRAWSRGSDLRLRI